jgi:hypothetical protein
VCNATTVHTTLDERCRRKTDKRPAGGNRGSQQPAALGSPSTTDPKSVNSVTWAYGNCHYLEACFRCSGTHRVHICGPNQPVTNSVGKIGNRRELNIDHNTKYLRERYPRINNCLVLGAAAAPLFSSYCISPARRPGMRSWELTTPATSPPALQLNLRWHHLVGSANLCCGCTCCNGCDSNTPTNSLASPAAHAP